MMLHSTVRRRKKWHQDIFELCNDLCLPTHFPIARGCPTPVAFAHHGMAFGPILFGYTKAEGGTGPLIDRAAPA